MDQPPAAPPPAPQLNLPGCATQPCHVRCAAQHAAVGRGHDIVVLVRGLMGFDQACATVLRVAWSVCHSSRWPLTRPASCHLTQVVYATALARTWHLMSQRDRALLCSLAAASAGNIAWRWLAPAHFAKWSCLTSVAMRCLTLGLGVAAYTMRAQLDEAGPPAAPPASTALGITIEAVVVLVRLLFASLVPFMLLFHTTWHLRLG